MTTDPPLPKAGLCEHGRVRTLCPDCRQTLADARPAPAARYVQRGSMYRRPVKDVPEARVACAACGASGSARAFVEDVDAKRYLCRTHAAALSVVHVTYSTSGRVVEAAAPSAAHWKDVLRDSRATSVRAFSRPPASRP